MPITYVNIASTTLGSNQATVTFSSIANTYTDLVIRGSTRTTSTSLTIMNAIFNGDSSAKYDTINIRGNGATASSQAIGPNNNNIDLRYGQSSTATANTFNSFELYLPNYLSTTNKTGLSIVSQEDNSTTAWIVVAAQLYMNTSAITSITINSGAGSFIVGSSFYLYGIKNS